MARGFTAALPGLAGAVLVLTGCDSGGPESTGPGRITTLAVRVEAPWSTTLEWVAPPRHAPLSRYELWIGSTPQFEPPGTPIAFPVTIAPAAPGVLQKLSIGDRRACRIDYFALVTYDNAGNPSDFSNVVRARTPEITLFADREQTPGPCMGVTVDEAGVVYTTELLGAVTGWNYADQTTRAFTVTGAPPLSSPRGVAARHGRVFVADRLTGRIVIFDADGVYRDAWNAANAPGGELRLPVDVAVAGNGEVYVVDARDRVVVLGPQGDFRREWGVPGIALGQFEAPLAVEVDEQSRIYVLDAGNHRVQVLDPAGAFLTGWGHYGSGESGFLSPTGLAIGAGGEVLVCDFDRNDVQRFTADGSYRGKWGEPGTARGQFSGPTGIAIDVQGFVYVTESDAQRLQCFGPQIGLCGDVSRRGRGASSESHPERQNQQH